NVTRIGYYAFEECTSLTGITIPDSVTVIEHHAFFSCTGLESITLGKGVKEIGNSAFYDCSSLETVYYTGTEEQWYAIKAGSYNELLKNATVVFNYKPEGEIHTVTTLKDESHILSVTGGGEYKSGQSVTVSAVPCETEYLDAELQIRLNVSEGLLSGGKVYYVNESLCADWASAINEYESSGLLAVGLYCATEFATGKYSAVVPYFDGTYSVIINGSKAHAVLVNKSRIEYEFVKWVDATDGSETAVSTDTDYTFVMPDHDVVLKAIGLYHLYSTDGETIIDKTGTVCCSAGNVYAA
ncbi:MAG: leucine-rich repeat domain-containing protein, partial [Clostridia bacterium]|nr:leucine-rich repeat domain-containing protein [Clostridia bacterium]